LFYGEKIMTTDRPLDALNAARDKRVMIELKNKQKFSGLLKSFDIHINTVLEEAQELSDDNKPIRNMGKLFLRGDTIVLISPE